MGSGIIALVVLCGLVIAVFTVQSRAGTRDDALQQIRNERAEDIKKRFHEKFGDKHGVVRFNVSIGATG